MMEGLIKHGYADVNGIRLHFAEAGQGESLVLLLHGFPEFWYSWRHQFAVLSERFHVVAPDMRGYNLSDKPTQVEDYRVDVLVDDVIGLIDHFGARQAALVAHDWGGAVAWAVALKHPDRVSSLAVMQVPPAAAWRANLSLRQVLRSWYMFFFQVPKLPEWLIRRKDFRAIDGTFADSPFRKGSFSKEDVRLYKDALRQPGSLSAALNYYRANVFDRLLAASSNKSDSKRRARVQVPTLFIFAEQDFAILPATVKGINEYIDAPYREVRIPDSGHWVQNEAPEEVNRALLEFLSPLSQTTINAHHA